MSFKKLNSFGFEKSFLPSNSPDRMANYERVFLNTIKHQEEKFPGQNPPENIKNIIDLNRNNTTTGKWTNIGGGRHKRDSKQYLTFDGNDDEEDIK